jgi:cytochrome c-type biogenesis protein CcmF
VTASTGYAGLVLATAACVLGISTLVAGLVRHDDRLLVLGRRFVFVLLAGVLVAVGAMEYALITHDFSIRYVADHVARGTPGLFTVTALWGALEGSILLWALWLAIYIAATAVVFRRRATDPLIAWATVTALVVALFFVGMMTLVASVNPFRLVEGIVPSDGAGPNPLLQNHPLMAFHPPMLYAGYVGMTIPFAFAIGALVTGRVRDSWLADVRRSTLIAWGCLTVGIVLGAWWSYEVLGWGGYWAWDPVENASLLPWLTATAFLHSVMVQERRGILRVWNISLVVATFCLTILGTFLTRSGVISSVHAFSNSTIGPALLGFLGFVVVIGLGLIAWRADALRAPGSIEDRVSRESAFLANNLLFSAFMLVVLLGTVFPLFAEAVQDRQLSVGEPYFDRMTTPLGLALLFLMAVAPLLPWSGTSDAVLRDRLLVPAWAGAAAMATALLLGAGGLANLLAYGFGGFALAGIVRQYALGLRARRRRGASERRLRSLARLVRSRPSLYGGLVVHAGVVVVAVALAASAGSLAREEVRLSPGRSATVEGVTVTYLGSTRSSDAQKTTVAARVRVREGGRTLGTYAPAISSFPNFNGGIGTPSVHTGIVRDVYVTLVSSPDDQGRVTLGVAVNPMILWLWIGGLVMAFGTALAVLPARADRTGTAGSAGRAAGSGDEPEPERDPEPVPV